MTNLLISKNKQGPASNTSAHPKIEIHHIRLRATTKIKTEKGPSKVPKKKRKSFLNASSLSTA